MCQSTRAYGSKLRLPSAIRSPTISIEDYPQLSHTCPTANGHEKHNPDLRYYQVGPATAAWQRYAKRRAPALLFRPLRAYARECEPELLLPRRHISGDANTKQRVIAAVHLSVLLHPPPAPTLSQCQ